MIPHQQDDKFISHGVKSNNRFKLLNNSSIMDILSNRIYSDKFAAVLREIGCNAYDAHVAAGKKNVPFSVVLPTDQDPRLIIRDFGHGLKADDVIELYTTYGFSSKTDSNDYVGFMGIGSKSPFCYTSTFEVNSYHEGKKNSFLMFKDDENIPNITHFGSIDCDAPSGLEIVIPVNKTDIYNFETKAKLVYEWFDVLPDVKKGSYKVPLKSLLGELKKFDELYIDTTGKLTGPVVKMGNIIYSLKKEQIPTLTNKTGIFYNTNFLMNFDIGEVEVDSGREGLQYTKNVIKTIDEKLKSLISRVETSFNAELAKLQKIILKKKFASQYFEVLNPVNAYSYSYERPRWIGNTFKFDYTLLTKELYFSDVNFTAEPEEVKTLKNGKQVVLSEDRYPRNTMYEISSAYRKRQTVFNLSEIKKVNVLGLKKVYFYKEGIKKELLNQYVKDNHEKETGCIVVPSRFRKILEDEFDLKKDLFDLKIDDTTVVVRQASLFKLTFPIRLVDNKGIVKAVDNFSPEENMVYIVLPFKYGKLEVGKYKQFKEIKESELITSFANNERSLKFDLIKNVLERYNKFLVNKFLVKDKVGYSFVFVNSKNKKAVKNNPAFMMIDDLLDIITLDDKNIRLYPGLDDSDFKQVCEYILYNNRNINQYETSFAFAKKLIPLFFKPGDKLYDFISDNEIQDHFTKLSSVSSILQLNSFFSRFFDISKLDTPTASSISGQKKVPKVLSFINVSNQIDTIKYYVESLSKANLS